MTIEAIDGRTLQALQSLIRTNLAGRDALYATAQSFDADVLEGLCRRLADKLGGHVADLTQLLAARGAGPIAPDDALMIALREVILTELRGDAEAPAELLENVEGAHERLRSQYQAAIDSTDEPLTRRMLERQSQDTEYARNTVLTMKEALERPADK